MLAQLIADILALLESILPEQAIDQLMRFLG